MTAPPVELVVLAVLLLVNRLVIPGQAQNLVVYTLIQLADLLAAAVVLWRGLPGLDAFPVVRWLVAGLLVFHVAQNASIRSRKQHDAEMRTSERELHRTLRQTREPPP